MRQTIVVIEDDADLREIFRAALERRGYRVVGAAHGAEGVTKVRRQRPELVLMDLRMPVMDGWQALQYLKADPHTAGVPVWGISAYSAHEVREEPTRVRFDRVLMKPIEPDRLVHEIEGYLGPPSRPHFH